MDLDAGDVSHRFTVAALDHALVHGGHDIEMCIERTDAIGRLGDGVLIGPGSPYRDPVATESVIERARRYGLPLVGT